MMNITTRRLLSLLRCSLLEKTVDGSLFASMADADWEQVYNLAERQGVTALVFDAFALRQAQEPSIQPGIEWLMEWLGQSSYIEQIYEGQEKAASELALLWAKAGLRTIVMKGLAVAQCYPVPKHRQCGDLDCFLVEMSGDEQLGVVMNGHERAFEKGNELVEALGVTVDRDYYKNSAFDYNDLHIENHLFCTQIRGSKKAKQLEQLLERLLTTGKTERIGDTCMEIPCPMFNALFLTEHAKNHFLREGISLRHVCDWMMFRHKYLDSLDVSEFEACCHEFGLSTFADSMNHLADFIANGDEQILNGNDLLLLNDILKERVSTSSQSFSLKGRLVLVNETLKEGWKYRKFADISMIQWLWQSTAGYFFDKNPKI